MKGLVESFIAASNSASTQEALFDSFRETLAPLGFDGVVYGLLNDHPSLNLKAQMGVMSGYPADWLAHYNQHDYIQYDPVVRHCFSCSRAFTWRALTDSPLLPKMSRRVMDEASEAGLCDGMAVPIHGPNFEVAGIGLASSAGGIEYHKDLLTTVQALVNQFHFAYTELAPMHRPTPLEFTELTAREREILLWSAEAKSVSVIAEILNTSDNNVKYHLKKIYKKLGVTDRMQAVIKAIFLGLISPPAVDFMQSLPW